MSRDDDNFPPPPDNDDYDVIMPFDDDDDERPAAPRDSLRLSTASHKDVSGSSSSSDGNTLHEDIGGLDASEDRASENNAEEDAATPKKRPKKRRTNLDRTKKRKLRKIVLEDNRTTLSGDFIKAMIHQTDDIVLDANEEWDLMYLDRVPDKEYNPWAMNPGLSRTLTWAQKFARPNIADEGYMAPQVLELWLGNVAPVLDKPYPFQMKPTPGNKKATLEAPEIARRQSGGDDDSQASSQGIPPMPDDDEDLPPPFPDDDDVPPPMDDDAENLVNPMEDSGFAEDMNMIQSTYVCAREFAWVSLWQSYTRLTIANNRSREPRVAHERLVLGIGQRLWR